MGTIELHQIIKNDRRIEYSFSVSANLQKYFTDTKYYLEYPVSIESVPDSIAVIPFITNMIQIMWITDCNLIIPELDKCFYECLPSLKLGFEEMYPEVCFKGTLKIGRIVDNYLLTSGQSAVFYSGGLDSAVSLLRHIDEKPHLVSIWGSDVEYDNEDGWKKVQNGILEVVQKYDLPYTTIRSSFRKFDDSIALTKDYGSALQTSWWYGVKHGIGIIGHIAPYAWINGITKIYMASSNCPTDGKQKCASDPSIDNCLRFFGAQVYHDGFELNRQDKIEYMVHCFETKKEKPFSLHVCWKSSTGNNCCICEKCFRTMVGIWIAGAEPKDYGFYYDSKVFKRIYQLVALRYKGLPGHTWTYMKESFIKNKQSLPENVIRGLQWMENFDFLNEESNKCRVRYNKTWLLKGKLLKLFPGVYKAYIRIRGYKFE